MLKQNKIIEDFSLKPFGAKGWMRSDKLSCPSCGRSDKFGLFFDDKNGTVHCFVCEYKKNIYKYLKEIGRSDLISESEEIHIDSSLVSIKESVSKVNNLPLEKVFKLPLGFRYIYEDNYLDNRKFNDYHYELFTPGVTDLTLEGLSNHIIFVLYYDKKPVGWIARSRKDYEWHKKNLELFKQGKVKLVLRYDISRGFESNKYLGGYDEITKNTKKLFLVEGLFDKVGLDNLLKLNESENIKCCFTFGNKVSDAQIDLIKKTNIEEVILMYDWGTVKQSKSYSLKLSNYFNTFVCSIEDENIDPGNMDLKYLKHLLDQKVSALDFFRTHFV